MSKLSKMFILALAAVGSWAMSAQAAEPASRGFTQSVIASHEAAPALTSVAHHPRHRHHHRARHRAHPVRHVR